MTRTNSMPTNFRHHVLTSGNKLTVPELAESYQVTEPTIRSWMRLTGVGKRPVKNGVDKGRVEVMLERGFRAVEIARLMGCSKSSIDKWRRGVRRASQTISNLGAGCPVGELSINQAVETSSKTIECRREA